MSASQEAPAAPGIGERVLKSVEVKANAEVVVVERHPGMAMCSLHQRILVRDQSMAPCTWRCPVCRPTTTDAVRGEDSIWPPEWKS